MNISKKSCCNWLSFPLFFKITLAGNKADFEEFTFLSRRTSWVRLTVKNVTGNSGGVGIKEIEFYNEMCKQSKLLLNVRYVRARNQLIDEQQMSEKQTK